MPSQVPGASSYAFPGRVNITSLYLELQSDSRSSDALFELPQAPLVSSQVPQACPSCVFPLRSVLSPLHPFFSLTLSFLPSGKRDSGYLGQRQGHRGNIVLQ